MRDIMFSLTARVAYWENRADAAEAALEAERAKVARVRAALAYDSAEHHADAACTDRCMDGFRARVAAALDGEVGDE